MRQLLVKIAKYIYAESIKDILVKYLKTKNVSELEIDNISSKFKLINPNIQRWFVSNFIKAKKNIQDFDVLITAINKYKNLSQKYHKKISFDDTTDFKTLYDFIIEYEQKQNITFKKPTHCKLIYESANYKFYYADARDYKCYQELHKINNGYANWCVILGTADWGDYTTSKYPFYIYCTKKDNTPFILFNFGNDDNAQIKDIHDNTFTQYDKQLIDSINEIASQYDFKIKKKKINYDEYDYIDDGGESLEEQDQRPQDYKLLNDIGEMITDNSDWKKQDIQSNNLSLYKKDNYFIIANKNKQIQFIIKEDTKKSGSQIIKYGKEKYSSQQLLDILIDGRFNRSIELLIWNKYINQKSNKNIVQQIIKYQLKNDYNALREALKNNLITQKDLLQIISNKLLEVVQGKDKIFQLSKNQAQYDLLQFNLIDQDKIKQYIDQFANLGEYGMNKLIELARNKPTINIFRKHMDVLDKIIDFLVKDEIAGSDYILYCIIEADHTILSKQNWIKILTFYKNDFTSSKYITNIIDYQFNHEKYDNQLKKFILDNTVQCIFKNNLILDLQQNLASLDEFTLEYLLTNPKTKKIIDDYSVMFTKYPAPNLLIDIIVKYGLNQYAENILSKQTLTKESQKKLVEYFIDNKMDNTLYYMLDHKRIQNKDNLKLIDDYFGKKLN